MIIIGEKKKKMKKRKSFPKVLHRLTYRHIIIIIIIITVQIFRSDIFKIIYIKKWGIFKWITI